MIKVQIKAIPNASQERLILRSGEVVVYVTASPTGNQANLAITKFIAKQLGIASGKVQIVKGATNSLKTLQIEGFTEVPSLFHP
jgi:uncharacterized protein YggU (UPF0235/DUF167 family)